jgi:uncharacterized protein
MKRRKNKKLKPLDFKKRSYRRHIRSKKLISFEIKIQQTDLHILASADIRTEVRELIFQYRSHLESYLNTHPNFRNSLSPQPNDPLAPPIIKKMLAAGKSCEVGPMAAVAGAIAEMVGETILGQGKCSELIIENGGDIFLAREKDIISSIFAGNSPISNQIGIKIPKEIMPTGLCTSSGTVGHSLSLGDADSVTVLAKSTALADAAATRLGNEMKPGISIDSVLNLGMSFAGVDGIVIIVGEKFGACGKIELISVKEK